MKTISATHKKLGRNIKGFRSKLKMTQEELAFTVGVDRSYMGFVERGERNPTLAVLDKIAKTLRTSLSELLN